MAAPLDEAATPPDEAAAPLDEAAGSISSEQSGGSSSDGRGFGHGEGAGRIYGYTDVAPVLDGSSRCPHCFSRPCIIMSPPAFLIGSASPDARNPHKGFSLYRKFWRVLHDLGMLST